MLKTTRFYSICLLILLTFILPNVLSAQNSIFTNQVPVSSGNDSDYELGTKFTASQAILVKSIRFYKMAGETGIHTGKLWSSTGTLLGSVAFTGETASGWQVQDLTSPVMIAAGTVYVVSVNANSVYPITQNGLQSVVTNGILSSVADGNNGVFNETQGSFPSQSFNNSNYFVDLVTAPLPGTIFTTQLPQNSFNDGPYEMGTKFTVSEVAHVKSIRYYKVPGESGVHTGRLWDASGYQIASVTFTNETASGWQIALLPNTVEIYPENVYVVTVNSNIEYGATPGGLASSITNGIISSVADGNNGVFGAPGVFPTSSFNNGNYFRDVEVEEVLNPVLPPVELSWPIGGALIYSTTGQFSWYLPWGMGAGFHFDLLISTDPSMATYTVYNTGSNNLYSVPGLTPGETYYWRVRVRNILGWVYNTSAIQSFETQGPAPAPVPVLSWPIGNPTVYTLAPKLYWYHNDAAFGLTYEVEVVAGEPSALTGVANYPNVTDRFLQLSGLLSGTKYSWSVRSISGTGNSAWSTPQSFTTHTVANVVIPTPSWPLGDAVVYTTNPSLYWYLSADGTGLTYEVELVQGALTAFTGTPNYPNITFLSQALSGLVNGEVYKWKVRSKRGLEYSGWSTEARFSIVQSVANTPAVVPTPSWPLGGTLVYSTTTELRWWLGVSATGYTYDIEIRAGGLTGTPTAVDLTGNSYSILSLAPSTNYQWAIRAKKNGQYSAWSSPALFTTTGSTPTATKPIASWPIGGTTIYTTNQQLSWYLNSASAGLTYNLKVSTDPGMSGADVYPNLSTSYYALTGLQLGTTYYWQVQSTDGSVTSDFSDVASFVTWSGVWAVMPVVGSPVDGIQLNTNAPVLSWFLPTNGNITSYEVQYADNPDFNNAVTQSVSSTNFTITSGLENSTYFWRVRSFNETGDASQFSNAASFVPASPTSVEDQTIPSEFVLSQNYPNPFNPSTVIRFQLPVDGFVKAVVYDVLGSEVATLLNGDMAAGSHSLSFNASGMTSGLYFLRVTSGNFSSTIKMLLNK